MAPVHRVLVPTDIDQFHSDLARAYARRGIELVVGRGNFHIGQAEVDLLHILWPEELVGWKPPTEAALREVEAGLDGWARRATIVAAVNNLYPHGYEGNPAVRRLYEAVYSRSSLILHHSEASRRDVAREFPIAAQRPNRVTTLFNYERLRSGETDPARARSGFGFEAADFVVLSFGNLRKWPEVKLLMSAYDRARIQRKRLLLASRFVEAGSDARARLHRLRWRLWIRRVGARHAGEFIPDAEVHRYLEACDLVVVPRLNDLSSGLVPLAFTFGRAVVAPDHGAFPDYLEGTANPLYLSGDARSLAEAMERAASLDRARLADENRRKAQAWTWDRVIDDLLAGLTPS